MNKNESEINALETTGLQIPGLQIPGLQITGLQITGLQITGACENNLQHLSLTLEHNSLTVITGLSGSGKSSLAFDTIYAEGARRYIETFSPYTRQFLDRLHRPDLLSISGVRPALALEQRNRINSSRSTVGTVTEINDYLKILFARTATLFCDQCELPVKRESPAEVARELVESTINSDFTQIVLCFPLMRQGAASASALVDTLRAEGHLRYFDRATAKVRPIEELGDLDVTTMQQESPEAQASRLPRARRGKSRLPAGWKPALPAVGTPQRRNSPSIAENTNELLIVVDRVSTSAEKQELTERLTSSATQAYAFGFSQLVAILLHEKSSQNFQLINFSEHLNCRNCGKTFPPVRPSLFSFNSPLGACPQCQGFGQILALDPQLCLPDPRKSLRDGAIACWNTPSTAPYLRRLKEFCAKRKISLTLPWRELLPVQQQEILYGNSKLGYKGLQAWFDRLQKKRHKMQVRVLLSRYRSEYPCPSCATTRLTPLALQYKLGGLTLPEIWNQNIAQALQFFSDLQNSPTFNPAADEITRRAFSEVLNRLSYLADIGLSYLTLSRPSRTLSGGECQRVGLTSILGSQLVNTMLILDEPTVGLHPKDTARLLNALHQLQNRPNTVLVVEHDARIIAAADQVIDLGPGSGSSGGKVVFQGELKSFANFPHSITARYLSQKQNLKRAFLLPKNKALDAPRLILQGARANNLQNIDVALPLNCLLFITGASGSGKSTLLFQCLYRCYERWRQGVALEDQFQETTAPLRGLLGLEHLEQIVLVDQNPIGKSPRSNPATYTGAWDFIRQALAQTPRAMELGLNKRAFSFNVDGGRCPTCKGAGQTKVEMQFLADVFVECEACSGKRFQDFVLEVTLGGKNVLQILELTLEEALELFSGLAEDDLRQALLSTLKPLVDLGLGYLRLGQPLNAVSGGEAQRIKLAAYLTTKESQRCLFILDEPSTGLHPHNLTLLLHAFDTLLAKGHSIFCIEHNLELIAQADWLIDLGPEGGERGGRIVAEGPPDALLKNHHPYPESSTLAYLLEYRNKTKVEASTVVARDDCAPTTNAIEVRGAREHNLREVDVDIPYNKIIAVTGVSGSGKSSLAFDVLFSEGQRRYIDCLSPYARQYIKQLSAADVDQVLGIPPTVAVSQKTAPPLGVSTLATTTEIYQYLRLMFAKLGTQHCVHDDQPITSRNTESIIEQIVHAFPETRLYLFASVVSGRKGHYRELFQRALQAEISQARVDGKVINLQTDLRLERHKLHTISLLVGSITKARRTDELLRAAVEQCLVLGHGAVEVVAQDIHQEPVLYSIARVCPQCGQGYRELDPQDFSFRSQRGCCQRCGGRGAVEVLQRKGRTSVAQKITCPECRGARLGQIARHVYIAGKTIHDFCQLNARQLLDKLQEVKFPTRLEPVLTPILRELNSRLAMICAIGLDYLVLDRDASTLSGGEAQRLRLAKTLGSPLSGVCYVLDEPSIGLHPQDQLQLIETLRQLRDLGNTVVVVEHDPLTIASADYLIDVGPGGGSEGGKIVYSGDFSGVFQCQESRTGDALAKMSLSQVSWATRDVKAPDKMAQYLELQGASTHNLKNITARFPLGQLSVVAGVSGAGKSSLIHHTLVPALAQEFAEHDEDSTPTPRTWTKLIATKDIVRLIEIDQTPVGKTSTSTPISYLGLFDLIRQLYAQIPESRARGWSASHFSFNTGKGKCPGCSGRGELVVPMSFLPEARSKCETCNGLRYTEETRQITFQGYSLGHLLQLTFAQAAELFRNQARIYRKLQDAIDLGLGYLTLGQPTYTLSGGEAQRLKLVRELGSLEAVDTLYLLDEPTIGLHISDVERLLRVLHRLVERGNTVIVIEHDTEVIAGADYLLELGPGPGEAGGRVLFSGPPRKLVEGKSDTPTRRFLQRPEIAGLWLHSKV